MIEKIQVQKVINIIAMGGKRLHSTYKFDPSTPKIWLLILPLSCYTYPCELVMRILCKIKITTSTW